MRKPGRHVRTILSEKQLTVLHFAALLLLPFALAAQDYGLRFRSHEVAADSRTALELAGTEGICFSRNAELSLTIKFREEGKGYYGYVWRVLTSGGLNIDMVFQPSSSRFNLVIGKRASGLSFEVDSLYAWNPVRLILDSERDRIGLITPDTAFYKDKVGLSDNECIRVSIGRSHIAGIRAVDLPPMSVRDVRIAVDGKPRHYWPLDESGGVVARDVLAGVHAMVTNPEWIREEYQRWQLKRNKDFSGRVSLAFNEDTESVLVLSNDSLVSIPVNGDRPVARPAAGESNLVTQGDQAIYVPWSGELINIDLNRKLISAFDLDGDFRGNHSPEIKTPTDFWHHNKIVFREDSSLITIGGYGGLTYKNIVQRYSFNTSGWDTLTLKGDFIAPRYLAGMSAPTNNVSYLLGGYGSSTGDQMLYPEHYQDLYRINWKELRVEKVYELDLDREPYVFANSIVTHDSLYYGLVFPRFRSNSFLQLIRGSLSQPAYEMIGDSIPFYFHDTYSYADLFLAEESSMLVAVTAFFDDRRSVTNVEIHTLAFPPVRDSGTIAQANAGSGPGWLDLIPVASVFAFAAGLTIWWRFRKKKNGASGADHRFQTQPAPLPRSSLPGPSPSLELPAETSHLRMAVIRFFGGFSVRDRDGRDLTAKFTPLLKELFLLIALNTLRLGKGVPSSKLDELFWFDKSEKSARNNRSVNIAKLKSALAGLDSIELCKNADNWRINYDPGSIYIDYADYLRLIRRKEKPGKKLINELIRIVGNAPFLSEVQYEWLDQFKSATSSEIIETVSGYMKTIGDERAFEHQLEVANFMAVFDPVSEEAMHLQCRALSRMGNHTLAKNAYEKFCKEYFALYAESYKITFQQILEARPLVQR